MYKLRTRLRDALVSCILAGAFAASSASAATLQVTSFAAGDAAGARAALAAFRSGTDGTAGRALAARTETFKNYRAWNGKRGAANPTTSVGRFTSLGGRGDGKTAVNGGTALQVRKEAGGLAGRQNLTGRDGKWLDSNDTRGMRWNVSAGPAGFNAIAFLLTDVADMGAAFSIKVGDTLFSNLLGARRKLPNGSIQLVRILLPESVTGLTVELRNNKLNDGFGLDGATVATLAPVPLPPAVLLVASGAVALFGVSRRRRAIADAAGRADAANPL